MEEIILRKAVATDLETLLGFEQGVITAERPFDETLKDGHINYYDIAAMIEAPDVELVVAELDGELIGSGYARIEEAKVYLKHRKHGYLGFMFVKPDHRGKGVNKKVIEYLERWCISQNISELRLEVYHNNIAAIKAYQKIGFDRHMIKMRKGLK